MATIALAWELTKATSPIVGITKPGRVGQVADAFDISPTSEEVAYLEEPYVPHRLVGVMEQVQDSMLVQLP